MTSEQKNEIAKVESMIDNISDNEQSVIETLKSYFKIKPEERRYVKNYYLLAEKADKLNVKNTGESLINAMNINTKGSGTVIDIISQNSTEISTVFNGSDTKQFNSLPDKLTTENYNDVLYLYDKLNNADNKDDYIDILNSLQEKKSQIETIRNNIENINERILNSLYPFDTISLKDKAVVESICSDLEALSDYDKKQILGYDDVLKAKTKIETMQRNIIIESAALIVLLLLITVIVLRIRKRRNSKNKNYMPSDENEDW